MAGPLSARVASAPVLLGLLGMGALTFLSFRYPKRAAARRAAPPALPPVTSTWQPVTVAPPVHAPGSVEGIITKEALAQGVDPRVALLFADLESGFNANALHDQQWPLRNGGENYRKHVLDNPKFAGNPARNDPNAWIGYGLYGLLSPYFAGPLEHPRVLLNPTVNAQRGVAFIRRKLEQAGGDLRTARLRYVGCYPPERCSPAKVTQIDRRLAAAQAKWGIA